MDKNWWKRLKQNKALKLFKTYLYTIINNLNEREIKGHMFKKGLNLDEILIEESSKEIDNYLKIKIKPKKKINKSSSITENTEKKENKRNISLLYMCLLKFNGLLRYMYFQGLNHDDINKMAHFIKHTFRKKGSYVFRQNDKSDALYGVIKGKAVIRLVNTIDYTKKFMNEASNGGDFYCETNDRINIQCFMSDCEVEEDEEEEEEENEDSNDKEESILGFREDLDSDYNTNYNDNNSENNNNKNININKNNIKSSLKNNRKNINKEIKGKNKVNFKKLNTIKPNKRKTHKSKTQNFHNLKIQSSENQKSENEIKKEKEFKKEPNDDPLNPQSPVKKKSKKRQKTQKPLKNNIFQTQNPLLLLNEKIEKLKKKLKKSNEKIIIKAITNHQTPNPPIEGDVLENFIKEFEIESFSLTNGMCFGEWGLLYSIPRTTSIYACEDTDLFYLEKEFFNKILLSKFLKNDSHKINFLIHKFPIFKKDFKMRHIFTKIIPLFVNKDNIIYTPFDNAENIYLIYQGEGLLVSLSNSKDREDYIIRKNNLNIISRLQEGAIAGIESCLDIKCKYQYAFIITRDFSTLLKINIKFISELYKDFNKSLIPLYESQQALYQKIQNTSEKIKVIEKLKKRFSLSKVVRDFLKKNNKKNYSNDFKHFQKVVKYNKKNDNKDTSIMNIKKLHFSNSKLREIKLKIPFSSPKKIIFSNKILSENLSTNRQSSISPLSSERGKINENIIIYNSRNKNNFFSNQRSNSQLDRTNIIYKSSKDNSALTISHIRNNSALSINNNYNITSKEKKEKFLRQKILSFQNVNTGQFKLPLLSEMIKK